MPSKLCKSPFGFHVPQRALNRKMWENGYKMFIEFVSENVQK